MRAKRLFAIELGVLFLAPMMLTTQPTRADEKPPLIPRQVLFGNPDKASVQISPDGKHISFLAPVNGVLNVWVAPSNNVSAAKPITKDTHRGIRRYFWAFTNQHVLYLQDKGGDENWHIYSTDLLTNKIVDLTPFDGIQARVVQLSWHYPNEILIGINNRDPQFHDIYKINIATGTNEMVYKNEDGFVGFLSDDDMNLYFGTKMLPDGSSKIFYNTDQTSNHGWEAFTDVPAEDVLTTSLIGLNKKKTHVYMLDSRNGNTASLRLQGLTDPRSVPMASDPQADIAGVLIHPTMKQVQAVFSTFERRHWHVIDRTIKADFNYLASLSTGEFNVVSRTLRDKRWIVAVVKDDGPVQYYFYSRNLKKAKLLFTSREELERVELAKMIPVTITSRDGLDLVSYYTLPTWMDKDGDGKPTKPLPMVLFVHGGPWSRDNWGFNPYHQWLANRGYAVLSVNYRGSTGFGKKFINAGNFEWAGKMHDDLLDAVDWAVDRGIADRSKVAIMGGSYGGYATLVGLTFTPDVFACGVDIVGPSNLQTLFGSIPPYWKPIKSLFTKRVGDDETVEGRKLLAERSPITFVDRIKKSLLIGQGANDPRVKQAEADQIVDAMKAKHIPVTYVLFPDEGHGFARPENRMSFNAVAEAFLSDHLGGRFEPMSEDIGDSSITVPAGAKEIKNLSKMLKKLGRAGSGPT